jgi:hypothetical protein
MLAAAVAGRALDAGALLPGVHEAPLLRGGGPAWLTATAVAIVVAAGTSARWARTGSLRAAAAVVVPGQLLAFFAAEAVVRLANGRGPVDADGLAGAALQATIAVLLLVALTCAWAVGLRASPLRSAAPARPAYRAALHPTPRLTAVLTTALLARGPPIAAGT